MGRMISGYMVKEIASQFKQSPVTIGKAMMKVEDLLQRDKSSEKTLRIMEENLIKERKTKYRISVVPHLPN